MDINTKFSKNVSEMIKIQMHYFVSGGHGLSPFKMFFLHFRGHTGKIAAEVYKNNGNVPSFTRKCHISPMLQFTTASFRSQWRDPPSAGTQTSLRAGSGILGEGSQGIYTVG
jgi:hypothetical protein